MFVQAISKVPPAFTPCLLRDCRTRDAVDVQVHHRKPLNRCPRAEVTPSVVRQAEYRLKERNLCALELFENVWRLTGPDEVSQ